MSDLHVQRRLAAQIMKCSPKKIGFDTESLTQISESITKGDLKGLIAKGLIYRRVVHGSSRGHARKLLIQKHSGLRKGAGSRKGSANARSNKHQEWIFRIRKQRLFLKQLRDKELISTTTYHSLLNKAKGGYFRSERHLKIYINENDVIVKKAP